MNELKQITLNEWDVRYSDLKKSGLQEPAYGGILRRHIEDGDLRLLDLVFDPSPAALDLWNFLLTEEDRLCSAREKGRLIIGTMKDLGTVPVMVYSLPDAVAFYPDGAWWIPCVMGLSAGLLGVADSLGIDESFCPVRAMLGAFETCAHFPEPDMLICSAGAVCDDFSAIAQRLQGMGREILWWEVPRRRAPDEDEAVVLLSGGGTAPRCQFDFIRSELDRVRASIGEKAGQALTDEVLSAGIHEANRVRSVLRELREKVFNAEHCPMPALELLIAEMLAIHFCSDRAEAMRVLRGLVTEVDRRLADEAGFFNKDAVRVFWVNPVSDLRAMNLLEECGGRICGTEYLFTHALDAIPEDVPPLDGLALSALADPMIGPAEDRAARICRDAAQYSCEAVIISRIPGASHCALEGGVIADIVKDQLGIPVLEIEIPPVSDSVRVSLKTRIEALLETVRGGR